MQRPHVYTSPLVLFFCDFTLSYDSTRLSRILGMYFLAAAESELSHFADRTMLRVPVSNAKIFLSESSVSNTGNQVVSLSFFLVGGWGGVVIRIRSALKGESAGNPKMCIGL